MEKTFSLKELQSIAYFATTLIIIGILWGSLTSATNEIAKNLATQEETIKFLSSQVNDARERTVRLETQYATIIDALDDIKQSIQIQSQPTIISQ